MTAKAMFAAIIPILVLAACTGMGGPRDRYDYLLKPVANPSEVVATELAFARAAQEDGQWTAFREFSTGDAVMFVPEAVNAHEWLDKQQNPSQAVQWQPHQVWSSCDGTLAVTKGAWQRSDGSTGYFTTVWERQGNGEYKWVLDQGDVLADPMPSPEMIGTKVADCQSKPFPPAIVSAPSSTIYNGAAEDGTMDWYVTVRADGSRSVVTRMWDGSAWQFVVREQVSAE